jgi:hypothetical protein
MISCRGSPSTIKTAGASRTSQAFPEDVFSMDLGILSVTYNSLSSLSLLLFRISTIWLCLPSTCGTLALTCCGHSVCSQQLPEKAVGPINGPYQTRDTSSSGGLTLSRTLDAWLTLLFLVWEVSSKLLEILIHFISVWVLQFINKSLRVSQRYVVLLLAINLITWCYAEE